MIMVCMYDVYDVYDVYDEYVAGIYAVRRRN